MKSKVKSSVAPPSSGSVSKMARPIARSSVLVLFLAVFFLSVLTGRDLTWSLIVFALLKSFLAGILGWLFLIILSDTLVRSIAASAIEAQIKRRDGGLLYHFLPPDSGEILEEPSILPAAKNTKK